ncbi:flagellar filament capping protein FliD [Clostridium algidicarnis]|uniref:flagellar filament capping protein FliD n=1 Tax=Clostridium algidicarnis TaxID=37659 RepID=UPI001C0BEE6E|nr:flagellar filament capping protein FliD [Clostridium algidicarnis]MBU3195838.1 flagellar filament capping protein FliD [Clostridium algidicarnis]
MNISPNRITGLATGMDTDTMVKNMMKPYQMRMDKMKQDRQITQWRQEIYRDTLSDINNFKKNYFDVLKTDTYLLSPSTFTGYKATVSNKITGENPGVDIEALAGAGAGNYEVEVIKLAKGAGFESQNDAFKSKGILKRDTKVSQIGIGNSEFKISYGKEGIALDETTINSQENYTIKVDENMTIDKLMDLVKSETKGNVKLSFSELTQSFKFETVKTGENSVLSIDDSLKKLLAMDKREDGKASDNIVKGENSQAKIKAPGMENFVEVSKEINAFVIDNIKYSLVSKGSNNISIKKDVDKPLEKIKGFIEKYNEVIEKINNQISEKKQYKFLPLTEEQKSGMKEDEIKKWEDKAKQGLLKGDSNLEDMLSKLRSSFYDGVKEAGISITDLGISTVSDTTKRGKLEINETKLKEALENNPEKVIKLLTKQSDTVKYYDPDMLSNDREARWNEEGIFQRVNDILLDYTRTTRNSNGKKGLLIEKAGIKGDFSEVNNTLSKDMLDRDKRIVEMEKKLFDRENGYYRKFAALEKAMNKMNSQSAWLMQQFGGGQS